MFFNPGSLILFIACTLLSLLAAGYVKLRFARGQQVPLRSGMTGAEVAQAILRDNDVRDVTVHEHQGFLSDHYSPTAKTLNLSSAVYHGTDAAAAGVAAHEVGHALQHAQGSLSMWGRTVLVYPAHFGQTLAPWLIMAGLMMGAAHQAAHHVHGLAYMIAVGGVAMFGLATLCSLVIVANEFNASARARVALMRLGITRPGEEDEAVRGVLTAAGLTYVAAAVTAIAQLLYWAMQAGLLGGRSDDR